MKPVENYSLGVVTSIKKVKDNTYSVKILAEDGVMYLYEELESIDCHLYQCVNTKEIIGKASYDKGNKTNYFYFSAFDNGGIHKDIWRLGKKMLKINIHYSFLFLILIGLFAGRIVEILIFILIILLHELSHAITALLLGKKLKNYNYYDRWSCGNKRTLLYFFKGIFN